MFDALRSRFRQLRSSVPYWSLRYVEERAESLTVRQDTAEPPELSLDRGAMVTAVSASGCGYAATGDLTVAGLQAALDRATHWAQATAAVSLCSEVPERLPAPRGGFDAGLDGDVSVSRSELYDLLAAECRRAKTDERIVERQAGLELRRTEQLFLTNTGGELRQRFRYVVPYASVTANSGVETQTRSFFCGQQGSLARLRQAGFAGCGARLAEEALQLLLAPNCPSGRMDLVLMPDQMMLQIHESIGHPLELDRILGDERNYAGTSFVSLEMLGRYRYGSELLNVTFDPAVPYEFATYAFDDEGAPAEKVWLIRNGILERPLGGRLSQLRAGTPGTANARASGWNRPPIDRMANLNIEPGSGSLEALVGSVRRGVLMRTNVSWSIDDSRNKFQFGCEWGERIEDGRIVGVVKNPNYRGVSSTFWRSLSRVGGPETFEIHGTLNCGKGEPNQAIHCGHAAPACVFSGVDVFGGEAQP
jgi:predicted Zn-dependent protease